MDNEKEYKSDFSADNLNFDGMNEENSEFINEENLTQDEINELLNDQNAGQQFNYSNHQGQIKAETGSPLRIILFLIMIALLGFLLKTYSDRGLINLTSITSFFNKDKLIKTEPQKSSASLEDLAIAKEGDDFFASAVKTDNKKVNDTKPIQQSNQVKTEETQKNITTPSPQIQENKKNITKKTTAVKTQNVVVDVKLKPTNIKNTNRITTTPTSRRNEPFVPLVQIDKEQIVFDSEYDEPLGVAELRDSEIKIIEDLSKITVSGIMYDEERPSAIINAKEIDYLVHEGDVIEGFHIVNILKDEVVVKTGKNIFRPRIGEEVIAENENSLKQKMISSKRPEQGALFFNPVSVQKQFGGNYGQWIPNNVVEINGK